MPLSGRSKDVARRRSTSATAARTRTRCRPICRTPCRAWSASSARKPRCRKPSVASSSSTSAASRVGVSGHREYHAGWHTAIDLRNLLTVSEAIARSAIERKESRGGHFREDYPEKADEFGTFNIMVKRGSDGAMQVSRVPIPPMPGLPEGSHRGAEVVSTRNLQDLAHPPGGRRHLPDVPHRGRRRAWSSSTPCTGSRPSRRRTWRCGGTARRASAGRAQRKSTASRG